MSTVTVAVAVWGEQYVQFIPEWWAAVKRLERKPDEIVFAYGDDVAEQVLDLIPEWAVVSLHRLQSDNPNKVWNELIEVCDSDWLCVCPSDDRLLPEALNDVDNADDAELIVDSIYYKNSKQVWKGRWDFSSIRSMMPMPQLAIARKSLYERVGGIHEDLRWSDWAFYIDAYLADAKVYFSDIIRLIFDEGVDRVTESGPLLDRSIRDSADAELRAYAVSRGL